MKSTTQNIKAIRLQFGDLTITAEVEERLEELGFTPETLIEAIGEHKSACEGNPSIYCGTYGKFSGEKYICGLWIDLTTFNDYDDFLNFCNAIHADEDDPELMFQDYEAFPTPVIQRGIHVGGRLRPYPRILGYVRQARSGGCR